jgi:hypothetical protein
LKNLLVLIVFLVATTTALAVGFTAYHYTVKATQTHLEQQVQGLKHANRKLQIRLENLASDYIDLAIKYDALVKPLDVRLPPPRPDKVNPNPPPIQSKDKEC